MANPRLAILDNIVETLEGITTANGYNTAIQKVVKGKIILRTEMGISKLSAYCCVKYGGQASIIDGPFAQNSFEVSAATSEWIIYASMDLPTNTSWFGFLDDIEASLAKDPLRGFIIGPQGEYKVMDSYMTQISEPLDSGEFDEIVDDSDKQYKHLACFIRFVVILTYTPHHLSGGYNGGV